VPLIVSGGLDAENVGEAIAATRPYVVDVASGVESSPGVKDHERLRAFIEAAAGVTV
jgi:phosphoribosylanthranilate isomerase